jgi:hypothetical protein
MTPLWFWDEPLGGIVWVHCTRPATFYFYNDFEPIALLDGTIIENGETFTFTWDASS